MSNEYEDGDYEFEPEELYEDNDVTQEVSVVDTGAKIGDKTPILAYIGPEDKRNPEGVLKVIIPNFANEIPDRVAIDALNNLVFSQQYNPFLLDFKKIDTEKYEEKYKSFGIPNSVQDLFLMYDQSLKRPEDVSDLIDPKKLPEIYGAIDYTKRFGKLDLSDKQDIELLLNINTIVPFLLIKLYLKDKTILFRLMTDVKFDIIDDKEYGKSVAPISYSSFIQFKPIKRSKNENCSNRKH